MRRIALLPSPAMRVITDHGTACGLGASAVVLTVGAFTAASMLPGSAVHHPRPATAGSDPPHGTAPSEQSPGSPVPTRSGGPPSRGTPGHQAARPTVLALEAHRTSPHPRPAPALPHGPAASAPAPTHVPSGPTTVRTPPAPPHSAPATHGCTLTLELLNGVLVQICL